MAFSKSVSPVFQLLYYKTHGKCTTKSQERIHSSQSNILFYQLRVHCECSSLGQFNRLIISTGHVVEQFVLPSIPNPHGLEIIYLLKFPGLKGCSPEILWNDYISFRSQDLGEAVSLLRMCSGKALWDISHVAFSPLSLCETILSSWTKSQYMLVEHMNRFVYILVKNLWHNKMHLHFIFFTL